MTPGQALNLIDRAADAERDPEILIAYRTATGENVDRIPRWRLGSLQDRLELLLPGNTSETLREMGEALSDPDLFDDARRYIHEQWEHTPYLVTIAPAHGLEFEIQSDILEAYNESCKRPAQPRRRNRAPRLRVRQNTKHLTTATVPQRTVVPTASTSVQGPEAAPQAECYDESRGASFLALHRAIHSSCA